MNSTPDFTDRLALAYEAAVIRWEERDGFLPDSDLLDIADRFTTDAPCGDDDPADRVRADRDALIESLYALLTEEAR